MPSRLDYAQLNFKKYNYACKNLNKMCNCLKIIFIYLSINENNKNLHREPRVQILFT